MSLLFCDTDVSIKVHLGVKGIELLAKESYGDGLLKRNDYLCESLVVKASGIEVKASGIEAREPNKQVRH